MLAQFIDLSGSAQGREVHHGRFRRTRSNKEEISALDLGEGVGC